MYGVLIKQEYKFMYFISVQMKFMDDKQAK
jgi:hypothetical protein